LKPGGFFYIVEAHPTARMFPIEEDLPKAGSFRPFFPYFHDPKGIRFSAGADYADAAARYTIDEHEWQHTLGDIVNALTTQGLRIDSLREFPFCAWEVVAGCSEVAEKFSDSHCYFRRPGEPQLPLMFSLKATKP
jgi:hypothetical protein